MIFKSYLAEMILNSSKTQTRRIGAGIAWGAFLNGGVTPDVAAGLSVAVFALILGAFGLIAVRVNL